MSKKEVMDIYKRFSPSLRRENKDLDKLRVALFLDRLKLPITLFQGKKILEFGPGTGETSKYYAKWGGRIEFVELNEKSCQTISKKFKEEGIADCILGIHNMDFEEFSPEQKYDFVCAEGCLHLAQSPEKAFSNLVCGLKPGGFVVVAVPETMGLLQKTIMTLSLWKLSVGEERKIVEYARFLFEEDLARASKAGGRPIENIIYDKYVLSKRTSVPADKMLSWFEKNNIRYYSSSPDLWCFHLNDTHYQRYIDLAHKEVRPIVAVSKLFLSKARDYDADRIKSKLDSTRVLTEQVGKIEDLLSDFDYRQFDTFPFFGLMDILVSMRDIDFRDACLPDSRLDIECFIDELIDFISITGGDGNIDIGRIKRRLDSYEYFGRGFCGNGSQYYVGYKR